MRFSEYRRLKEEEEQNTGANAGDLSAIATKQSKGRKFTDIMKEREPERYARIMEERKANSISDFSNRVNQNAADINAQITDAADYINSNKDIYNLDADDNAERRHAAYETSKQQTIDLLKEANNNPHLDTKLREQAYDIFLQSLSSIERSEKANNAYADYIKQFDNKEAFERTREAERKQEEADTMSADELRVKIKETNAMIGQVDSEYEKLQDKRAKDALMSNKIGPIMKAMGLYKDSGVTKEDLDELEYQKTTLENDVRNYENMIFEREQQEALEGLTEDTKAAFEQLYSFGVNGPEDKAKQLLQYTPLYDGYAREKDRKELTNAAISALETQGIPAEQFDSLYEYYKFQRDEERTSENTKETLTQYEDSDALGKIGMNAVTVLNTPVRGISAAAEGLASLKYKNEYAPLNVNAAPYDMTNYTDTVRNATSQDIENEKLNFVYQTGMSMADMATLLPLSSVSGGASLALMGTNAGTSAAKEATLRGASKEQALVTGIAAGGAEVVFEKLSLDHFWDIARHQGKAATRNAFINILAQAGIEGTEEVATDLANHFADELINRGLSEWYQNMDSYYKQGMSMTEAQKAATADYCKQLGNSFWGGALSGGVFGTAGVVNTSLTGKKSTMTADDYLEVAEGIDTERNSYMSQEDYDTAMGVQQLAQALSKKETVTNYEKGLFEQESSRMENINWFNNPKEQIRQISERMPNETVARAFIADYKDGVPVDTYTRAFEMFYKAGHTEMPFEQALAKSDAFEAVIGKPTLYAIHSLGMNQAAEASKTFTSTEQKELVNTMAKALGVTVQYQDIPSANGMYKDGKIYISNKTINPSMVVMSHELTHHLKATVAEEYTAYENYVIDYFKEYHAKEYNVLYNAMTEQYGNDDAIIREEIAANAAETFLTDAEAVNRFVKQNRTIAEKIADFLNNFITKLKELYQGYKAQGKAGKMLAEDIEVYEKARDLWYEAVNVGQGKNNRTDSEKSALGVQFPSSTTQNGSKNNLSDEQQNGKTKFSLKPYSEHQIKNWSNSKNIVLYQNDEQYKQFIEEAREHKLGAKKIYFGTVSDYLAEQVMEKLGLDIEGYNCTLRAYEIEKIFKSHGNEKKERQRGQRAVTVEDLLKIPNIMGQPDSVTRNAEDKYEGKPAFHIKKDGYTLFVVIQDKHLDLFLQTMFVSENKKSLATAIDVQASILTPETTSGTASENSITPNHENDKQKFSLKVYTDEIGIRFSDKDGGDLFESILMGTDNVDYQSVLWDDGSESYRATMDLINESARILQDGITAAGKLKDFNVTRDMAQAMAAHYLNKYSATFDEDTLTNNLFNIFAYMQNTEDVNYQDMIRLMQEVCKPVIATSQKIDKEMMKQYNEFRKFVRSYHIKLNAEQKAEIASVYDSFRTFKNVNQNKYTFRENGSYLDTIWSDLVEASGYALSYDTPSSEQMLALHDYMTALEKSIISPAEDMDNSQVAYDMALNIYTDYFKLIGENKQAIKNLRTQMQKKLNEYKRDVREDYKYRFKKYKEETTIKTQDEINRLQKQIRQLERERDDALYTADDITVNILDGNINALEYKIGKLSQRNADKLAKLTAQSYNRSVQRAITRQQTEIKNHIKKNMFDLQNRLAKPKENKFIPQGLVKATIDLCEAVNIDTGKSQRLAERLGEMSHLYARMKDDKDYALSSEYDDQTQKAIDRLREVFTGRNITMLNMMELKEVDSLITQLRFQIVNASKLIGMEKSRGVYETAVKCMDEINAAKSYNPDNRVSRGLNKYNTSMLNPKRQFRRMSGYKDDSVLNQIYEDLNNGQQKQMQVLMETARIFDTVTKGEHNQKSISKLVGKEKKDWIDIGLNYKNMDPVIVPRAFRVSLAMHIQNKANMDHIIYGGLTIPEPKAYQRGDYATAYATGTTVHFIPAEADTAEKRQQAYHDAVNKLKSVVAQMTPYEKAMVKCAEKFFHEYTGEKINETSLQLNGYKKARVHNYFPIRTDSNFRPTEIEGLIRNAAIENIGMLNTRVGARNPILLEDITKVIQRQSENVAKYYGLAIPIRNFNKIYNTTKIGYQDSTKSVIARKWGVTGQKYIEDLITDLQTKRGGESTILDTLQGNFAQSVLSGNLSVAAQQVVAYPTAAATLGWDAVVKGMKYIPTKLDMEHIAKYTPLLWYRNQGTGTQEIGDVHKSKDLMSALTSKATMALEHHNMDALAKVTTGATEKVVNWEMELLQRIDTKAVGSLWKASEIYVRNTKKISPEQGEDAFYQEVAKVFNNCIDDTQANYSTMQRPDVLRSPKVWKKIFLFKTQPLQNFGIMYDAFGNLRAKAEAYKNSAHLDENGKAVVEQDYMKAKREFGRAIASQLAAAAGVFAMKLLANFITHRMDKYRNEEDEITGWKIVEELLNEVTSTMAGSVLGGSEVYNFINSVFTDDKYYGIGIGVIDSFNDFTNSLLKMIEDPEWDNLKQLYFDAGVLIGVPGENIYKFFSGLGLHAEDIKNGEPLSFNAGHETKLSVQYTTMMNALVDGDTAKYEKRYADTLETLLLTKTEEESKKAIKSGIKTKLKKNYQEAEISYDDAIAILEKLGDKEPYFTIKEWDTAEDKKYNKYAELEAAVISGQGIDEEIKELTDNGVLDENVNKNLMSIIREGYVHGDLSRERTSQYLKQYKEDFTDDDVYWELRKWDKSSSYEDGEEYSKYDDLLNAVESGNFEAAVKEYVEHGSDASSIKQQVSEKYRPLYQEAYLKGDYKTLQKIKDILNKLRVNGKRIYTPDDYVGWNKQAKKKGKEENK